MECKKCVNTTKSPTITINKKWLCNVCALYEKNFDKKLLKKELKFFKSMIGTENGKHDIMVGVSGGKDSTAALFTTKQMGFSPLAFTFDIGYYPKHVIP